MRFLTLLIILIVASLGYGLSAAQSTDSGSLQNPGFSIENLNAEKSSLAEEGNLSEDQQSTGNQYYDTAVAALRNSQTYLDRIEQLQRELVSSPRTIESLREQIRDIQTRPNPGAVSEPETLTGETLMKLEQDLLTRERELRALRAEADRIEEQLQELDRPLRQELSDAQRNLNEIVSEIAGLSDTDLGPLDTARRKSLQAREYNRRTQIQALEQEIASQSSRQQILTLRRNLISARVQRAEQEVTRLQIQTGQKRLSDARQQTRSAVESLSAAEKAHQFVSLYAAGNAEMSRELLNIATQSSLYPRQQANVRRRLTEVKNDLTTAANLTKLGEINRQSSAILRRLRNQRPQLSTVRAEINDTSQDYIRATQLRLWAQEELRSVPLGEFDTEALTQEWYRLNPTSPPLSDTDISLLRALYDQRRDLLLEVSDAAYSQMSELDALETTQGELLTTTESITELLDQKLLWLPSVEAVDLSWPQKIVRGSFKLFSAENLTRVWSVFWDQVTRFWFIVILVFILVALLITMRKGFHKDIAQRAQMVGRVQQDSYWHTPSVVLSCALVAAPIPLLVLCFGLLFKGSENPNPFIDAVGRTSVELSGFLWFFLTWKEWNRDSSLFDVHIRLPRSIRTAIRHHLRWFIPFASVTIALVTLTLNSRDPDIYEGLSLFMFIITALTLSYLGMRIIWARQSAFSKILSEDNFVWRHRRVITVLIVALPILAAILAAAGYYDTAHELLSRLFFSSMLVILSFVAFGLIRRTVVIAQRRIALRQALERREKMIKAREEKEAADERGEITPPQIDYEEIDLETISRQSAQLLTTGIVIGFFVLMWVFWQDLLPALSIFDNWEFYSHRYTDSDGVERTEVISLWNYIQAGAITLITIIAARNLPGFLEVFVLNRGEMDAGTRYAVVNILGYTILALGFFIAFAQLGIEWGKFQWILAALGVGIGFGLQEIIANFISGLIILFERPVRIGDYVTIGDDSGVVNRIQIRATTLTDLDNREILIPNKNLITERVMNWTLSNAITRLIVKVGVAYGSDTDTARQVILDTVRENEKVLESPRPQVFFLGFGDSSLDFEIRVFLRRFEERFPVSHEIHTSVNKALEKAGITIPFPQRDLHIISTPKNAEDTIVQGSGPAGQSPKKTEAKDKSKTSRKASGRASRGSPQTES